MACMRARARVWVRGEHVYTRVSYSVKKLVCRQLFLSCRAMPHTCLWRAVLINQHMVAEGIEALDCSSVDNLLARPGDPVFVALCHGAAAQCASRVVARTSAEEKVRRQKGGLVCGGPHQRRGKGAAAERGLHAWSPGARAEETSLRQKGGIACGGRGQG